ncbi:MAG: hypothetical protein O3A51_00100 [Verrucomicrobia bacterium]|nr:hypothetical protein [Verrucomicrobiota bacterium]
MSRLTFWLMHISTTLVAGTGLIYGWMRYVLKPVDDYAVVNHALQPLTQHLHILAAPTLAIMLGVFWQSHASHYWKSGMREGRTSGLMQWILALPMIMSGYLLQTATTSGWRTVWIWVHAITASVWTLGYLAHVFAHWRARRQRMAPLSS